MGKNKKNKNLLNVNKQEQNPKQPVSFSSNQNGLSSKVKSDPKKSKMSKMSKPSGSIQQKGLYLFKVNSNNVTQAYIWSIEGVDGTTLKKYE